MSFPIKIVKGFLPENERSPLRRAMEAGPWDTLLIPRSGREAKRKTVTYYEGDENAANVYMNKFGDKGAKARPFTKAPAELNSLRERLVSNYGHSFSLCYVNYYKDETTQIGWHRDREEEGSQFPLVMVCLGGARLFSIWKVREGDPNPDWQEPTESGDLVEMPVGFHEKDAFKHAVLPQLEYAAPRLSFTFRNPDLSRFGPWAQPKVWECHSGKSYPLDAVYVGCRVRDRKGGVLREGSIFGNGTDPLKSHRGWLKSEEEFRQYAAKKMEDPSFRAKAEKLRGKDLLCWCVQEGSEREPFCHARVWLELVNQ
jgi:alkylated DNA repair dioxygenase AlkB